MFEISEEASSFLKNRPSPAHRARRLVDPLRSIIIEDERIPLDTTLLAGALSDPRHVLVEPATGQPAFIPKVRHPRVIEHLARIDCVFRTFISGDDLEKDRVDADRGVRLGFENIRLHPPGALNAHASRRGQDEDEPHASLIAIESVFQIVE